MHIDCGVWAVCLMRSFSISVSSLLARFIRIRSVPRNLSKSCFKLAHLEINPEWDAIVHVFKDTRNLCNRSSGVVDQFNAAVHSGTLWEGLTSSHCASRSFGSQTSDFLCATTPFWISFEGYQGVYFQWYNRETCVQSDLQVGVKLW